MNRDIELVDCNPPYRLSRREIEDAVKLLETVCGRIITGAGTVTEAQAIKAVAIATESTRRKLRQSSP